MHLTDRLGYERLRNGITMNCTVLEKLDNDERSKQWRSIELSRKAMDWPRLVMIRTAKEWKRVVMQSNGMELL